MGLRDSLKALGLTAAGAAVELAQGGLGFADDLIKASKSPDGVDKDENREDDSSGEGSAEGGDKKAAAAGEGAIPSDKDLALPDPKSMFWDPFAVIEQLGYKERPSQITYGTLRAILYRMPVISDIIMTRLGQLEAFSRPQRDRYAMGYRIKLRDTEKEPTGADKKWITDMETLMQHTGVCEDPRYRDNFKQFIIKLMRDSLIYDQCCFEVVPNKKGQPCQWYPVDASTIRLADTSSAYIKKKLRDDTRYVQIYDGMIIAEYDETELCFGIRNPCTDIRLFGYGTSELELIMSTITSLLWAWQYNQRFFSQGSAAKGILNFKGAIPEHQLKGFRRHWYTMLSGVENAWRTPITNADELQWISVMENNKDMEFNAWMDFQIKVGCAAYKMNPIEINFQYGNVGQKGALSESSNKEKVTESRVRGLYPLLTFLGEMINTHIIWPTNPNFEFEFVGLDAGTQEDTAKLNQMRVKTTRTVDELRAEDDLEPLPDGLGEVILDPTWLQWAQQKSAEQNGGMPPGQEGPPGADPFGGGDQGDEGDGDEGDGEDGGDQFDFASLFGDEDQADEEETGDERSNRLSEQAKAKAKAKAQQKGKGERGNLGKSMRKSSAPVAWRVGQVVGTVARKLVDIDL